MERFAELEVSPRFWELIALARGNQDRLRVLLSEVDRDDLIRFEVEFHYMVDDLVSQAVEDAGDTYHEEDVAGWVVSRGLQHYAWVYDNPAEFPTDVPDWDANLAGVAGVVFEERFGVRPMPWEHRLGRWPTTSGRDLLSSGPTEPGAGPDPVA